MGFTSFPYTQQHRKYECVYTYSKHNTEYVVCVTLDNFFVYIK